jgi:two-component system sensor histidine kinase UhpB
MLQTLRRLTDRPLYDRFLIAHGLVLLAVVVTAVVCARVFPQVPLHWLLLACIAGGLALLALVDYVIMRVLVHPLLEVARVVEAIHRGEELPQAVEADDGNPNVRAVSSALMALVDRLEREARRYSSRLLTSIEDERRRIGRELHDETSQTLAAILISLDLAEKNLSTSNPEARARVANCKDLIQHALDQIKLLVYDLRPSMLDDLGLRPALRWYIQSHIGSTGMQVDTEFEGEDTRLPGYVETALYRIAQETLSNIVKHAHASKVSLILEVRQGYARLAIHDDGVGFDIDEVMVDREDHGGLGLLSIRERAELLNGTLNIVSGPVGGTHVYVVIPLKEGSDE